ncbi:MAG: thioredoxin family protein [ANME-2 cluster archaeon]|nr:thioredoxin family protein [ANME-2 cluster archaeon]MDF1557962.1 thioredoxin family protein [ANME-2 cluster archaeon]
MCEQYNIIYIYNTIDTINKEVSPIIPIIIEVLTSPTCSYCPAAVDMARDVANSTQDVLAAEISVATPEGYNKAMSHGVSGVPTILINDKVAFVGVPPSVDALKQVVHSVSTA